MEQNQAIVEKPPFYPHSYAESLRMECEGVYRQSMAANVACRDAIVNSIAQHFDGYRLGQVAKGVIAEYGFDRVAYVLANTIQRKDWDGRFSRETKAWAKEVFVPEDLVFGVDQRISFLADCSPGLLNLFTDQYREEVVKLNLWDKTQVQDASQVDFREKLMVLKPEILKETSRTRENQLFYCTGGVGCLPGKQGRTVTGQFQDGQKASFAREDFLGLPREELLHPEEPETDRIAYELESGFVEIHATDEGNAYTFYDEHYNLKDGGEHDDPEWTVYDVARDILAEGDVPPFADLSQFKQVDYDELVEKADNVAMSKIAAQKEMIVSSKPPYQLPDPTVSVADAHTYGYTAEELLPMEKARALELFGEGKSCGRKGETLKSQGGAGAIKIIESKKGGQPCQGHTNSPSSMR